LEISSSPEPIQTSQEHLLNKSFSLKNELVHSTHLQAVNPKTVLALATTILFLYFLKPFDLFLFYKRKIFCLKQNRVGLPQVRNLRREVNNE